jgi:flagellar hook assembly protein FlgD
LTTALAASARGARIGFSLGAPQAIRIDVFDADGRLVRALTDRWFPAGSQIVAWDGADRAGNPAGTGTYLYRLRGREGAFTGRLAVVR